MKVTRRTVALSELEHYPGNARIHDLEGIKHSLERNEQYRSIVVQASRMRVIAGNGTLAAARELGWKQIRCEIVDVDDEHARRILLVDNRQNDLAGYDEEALVALLQEAPDLEGTGYGERELVQFMARVGKAREGDTDPDDAPEPPAKPTTRPGDLYELGSHRLLCGDCTVARDTDRLIAGASVHLLLTDPPYCSGGFQESGRAQGSVGTSAAHKQIANDRLSTRGYVALLKSAFATVPTPYLYVFTDWRMWVYLFDVVESSGFGVRSMIVWNKGTPGMGRGWRSQHELIMWGAKQTPPFDKHASGVGNVIDADRTGNELHTTQKPVDLLGELLANTPFARVVYDPFAGAGSTLIAAEEVGRAGLAMELDPAYCDVIVERWEQFTGGKAKRERRRKR